MLLNRLVATSREVAGTRSRLKKRDLLAECLRCDGIVAYARLGRHHRGTYWCDRCQPEKPAGE